MARHKIVNGVRIEFTPEEEAARDAEEAAWEAGAFDRAMVGLRSDRDRNLSDTDWYCLLYTSPSPRDGLLSRMPSSA